MPGTFIGIPEPGVPGIAVILDVHPADAVFHTLSAFQALQRNTVQAAEDVAPGKHVIGLAAVLQLHISHAGKLAGPQDRKRGITGIGDPGPGFYALGKAMDR